MHVVYLSLLHHASALVATTLTKQSTATSSYAPPESSVVVGAGPAGLATAIMLAKRGWQNVQVFDRLPAPPGLDDDVWSDTARFYLIGIGGRGQRALKAIGSWDAIEPYTALVRGRKDWAPGAGVDGGVETVRADRPPSNVIQRDRLVACLLSEVRGTPAVLAPRLCSALHLLGASAPRLIGHAPQRTTSRTVSRTASRTLPLSRAHASGDASVGRRDRSAWW